MLQTSPEDTGAVVQPPCTGEQAHAEGAASQEASAAPALKTTETQLALTGEL